MNARLFLLFVLLSLVSACGMKGSLIPPPGSPPPSLYDKAFGRKISPKPAADAPVDALTDEDADIDADASEEVAP